MKNIKSEEVSHRDYTRMVKMLKEIIDLAEDEEMSTLSASNKAGYILEKLEPNTDEDYGPYPDTHLKNTQILLDTLIEIRDNYNFYSIIGISEIAKATMRKIGYEEEYPTCPSLQIGHWIIVTGEGCLWGIDFWSFEEKEWAEMEMMGDRYIPGKHIVQVTADNIEHYQQVLHNQWHDDTRLI